MTHDILIATANEDTGKLTLTIGGVDADSIGVERRDKVIWSIGAPNVYSFRIDEKNNSKQIFSRWSRPSSSHSKSTKGKVKRRATIGDKYIYCIHWRAIENGPELDHDPQISVMPTRSGFIKLLTCIIPSILTLVGLGLLFRKSKR